MGITLYQTLSARTSPVRTLEKINAPPLPGLRLLAVSLLCGVAAGTVLITQAAVPTWAAQGLVITGKLRTLWNAYYAALLPVLGLFGEAQFHFRGFHPPPHNGVIVKGQAQR